MSCLKSRRLLPLSICVRLDVDNSHSSSVAISPSLFRTNDLQCRVSTDFNAPDKDEVFKFMDKAVLESGVNLIDTVSGSTRRSIPKRRALVSSFFSIRIVRPCHRIIRPSNIPSPATARPRARGIPNSSSASG